MILQNQIRCNKCGDEPFSTHVHDFRYCKCGAVAVDGGMSYLRRLGHRDDYTELSYEMNEDVIADCKEALTWARDTGRNELGTICAVIRALKKHNMVKV